MPTAQHTASDVAQFDAWPVSEPERNTWFGVEIQSTESYDPATHTIVGGFYTIEGAEFGTVTVLNDTGTKLEAFNDGDPGYHVHFTQAPGSGPFVMSVSLVYEVTTP